MGSRLGSRLNRVLTLRTGIAACPERFLWGRATDFEAAFKESEQGIIYYQISFQRKLRRLFCFFVFIALTLRNACLLTSILLSSSVVSIWTIHVLICLLRYPLIKGIYLKRSLPTYFSSQN